MKQAYILLAHKNPQQIQRLISALDFESFDIFIHIDKRVQIEPFIATIKVHFAKVHFIANRFHGNWGGLGIVQATVNAMEEIISTNENYTHVSVLSGQDYPIKSNKTIHDFFNNHLNDNFIEYEPFPVKHMSYGGLERIRHYSFNILGKRHTYLPFKYCQNLTFKGRVLNSTLFLAEQFLPNRKIPNNLTPYYGSQWWSLNFKAVNYIVSFLKHNKNYFKFHKYSLLPDEMFFQTILLNSEENNTLRNDNKRFILWNPKSSHPISLSSSQLPEIKLSNKFFARKFEENESILDEIDELINP